MADIPSEHEDVPSASGEGDTGVSGMLTRALTQLTEQTTVTSKAVQTLAELIAETYKTTGIMKAGDAHHDA